MASVQPLGGAPFLDIQICQACGFIIRGKGKFCTGCGVYISKFSPTALPAMSQGSAPLAVTVDPDPLVLERAIALKEYAGGNGGNGGGNGGYDPGKNAFTSSTALPQMAPPPAPGSPPPAQTQPSPANEDVEINLDAKPQAPPAQAPTSVLGGVLGGATRVFGKTQGASASSILSLIDDEPMPQAQPAAPQQAPAGPSPVMEAQAPVTSSPAGAEPPAQAPGDAPATPRPTFTNPALLSALSAVATDAIAPEYSSVAPGSPAEVPQADVPPPEPPAPAEPPQAIPSSGLGLGGGRLSNFLRPTSGMGLPTSSLSTLGQSDPIAQPMPGQAGAPSDDPLDGYTPPQYAQPAGSEPGAPWPATPADTIAAQGAPAPAYTPPAPEPDPDEFPDITSPYKTSITNLPMVNRAQQAPAETPPQPTLSSPLGGLAGAPMAPSGQAAFADPAQQAPPEPQPLAPQPLAPQPFAPQPVVFPVPQGFVPPQGAQPGYVPQPAPQPVQPEYVPQPAPQPVQPEYMPQAAQPEYIPQPAPQPIQPEYSQQAIPQPVQPGFLSPQAMPQPVQPAYVPQPAPQPPAQAPVSPVSEGLTWDMPDESHFGAQAPAEPPAFPDPALMPDMPPAPVMFGAPEPVPAMPDPSSYMPQAPAGIPPMPQDGMPPVPVMPADAPAPMPLMPQQPAPMFADSAPPAPPAMPEPMPVPEPVIPPAPAPTFDFFNAPPAPAGDFMPGQAGAPPTNAPAPSGFIPSGGAPPGSQPMPDLFGNMPATPPQPAQPQQSFENPAVSSQAVPSSGGLDFFADNSFSPAPQGGSFSQPAPAGAPQAGGGGGDFFAGGGGGGGGGGGSSQDAFLNSQQASGSFAPQTVSSPADGFDAGGGERSSGALSEQSQSESSSRPSDARGSLADSMSRSRMRDMSSMDDSRSQPPSSAEGIQKYLEMLQNLDGDIDIMGRTFPKKQALIGAVAAVFIGFIALNVIGGVLGAMFKGGGAPPPQQVRKAAPTLTGEWELAFAFNGRTMNGGMRLEQQGSQIAGEGNDGQYFMLNGTLQPPKVQFAKQYVVNGSPQGEPVVYTGTIEFRPTGPYMSGVYEARIKKGIFPNAPVKVVRDNWEAAMTQSEATATATASAPPQGGGGGDAGGGGEVDQPTRIKKQQEFFGKVAGGILLFGALLAFASLKFFGPAGLLNIWAKREYIPSQFKAQWGKMLSELGKPPKPGGVPLGMREDWNITQFHMPKELAITPEMRETNPHMICLGAGAKGKSRLVANMITHDIESNERAVVVIDSDGGLVELVMRWIASHPRGKELAERVIVVDPTHKGGCPAYNPLEEPSNGDLQSAASAVVYGFKAIYMEPPGSQSQWNQQTANILRSSAVLLMANGKTLTDLPTLLNDNDFRDVLLDKIERRKQERTEFITLMDTWGQYKRLARTDQWITWVEPILNRVSPMLSDPRIRPILTKPKGDLNLRDIITEGKVLLVKVPQGQLDQNANLLGSLLVTGLKQAALSISMESTRRHPCAVYLDELDNFIEKETWDAISSETRKFQLGLVGTLKSLQHLPEDFRNQLIINAGTLCIFALAKKDGDMLGPQMFRVDGRKVKHQTLQNIFNKVNTSPQFELISDEEKLNIDRVVGQELRTYFCYRVGTVAGVFHMKSKEFKDILDKDVNWTLMDEMYVVRGPGGSGNQQQQQQAQG